MKLRVHMEWVKSTENATYVFEEGSTCICGDNGVGKTTILEAIAWALYGATHVKDIYPVGDNSRPTFVSVKWGSYKVKRHRTKGRSFSRHSEEVYGSEADALIFAKFGTWACFKSYVYIGQGHANAIIEASAKDRESIIYSHIIGEDDKVFEIVRRHDSFWKEEALKLEEMQTKSRALRGALAQFNFDEALHAKLAKRLETTSGFSKDKLDRELRTTLDLETRRSSYQTKRAQLESMLVPVDSAEISRLAAEIEVGRDQKKLRDEIARLSRVKRPSGNEAELRERLRVLTNFVLENSTNSSTDCAKRILDMKVRSESYKNYLKEQERYVVLLAQYRIRLEQVLQNNAMFAEEQKAYAEALKHYRAWVAWKQWLDKKSAIDAIREFEIKNKPEPIPVVSDPGHLQECPHCRGVLTIIDGVIRGDGFPSKVQYETYLEESKIYHIKLAAHEASVKEWNLRNRKIKEFDSLKVLEADMAPVPVEPKLVMMAVPREPSQPKWRGSVPIDCEIDPTEYANLVEKVTLFDAANVREQRLVELRPQITEIGDQDATISRHSALVAAANNNETCRARLKALGLCPAEPARTSDEIRKDIAQLQKEQEWQKQFNLLDELRQNKDAMASKIMKAQKAIDKQTKRLEDIDTLRKSVAKYVSKCIKKKLRVLTDTTNSVLADILEGTRVEFHVAKGDKYVINYTLERNGQVHDSISFLSGGQKARLTIAFTLAIGCLRNPPFMLFDETFASLSETVQDECITLIHKMMGKKPVLYVMHNQVDGWFDHTLEIA